MIAPLWLGAVAVGVLVGVAAADNSPPVSADVLKTLFRSLPNPRFLAEVDIPEGVERDEFALRRDQFSFWLTGDFDRDGRLDVVVAGVFDNAKDKGDSTFVALISQTGAGSWETKYFVRPKSDYLALRRTRHPNSEMAQAGYEAVVVHFTILGSHDYLVLAWDGLQYRAVHGFDLIPDRR